MKVDAEFSYRSNERSAGTQVADVMAQAAYQRVLQERMRRQQHEGVLSRVAVLSARHAAANESSIDLRPGSESNQ